MKVNTGPVATGLHCSGQSLVAFAEQIESVDLAMVKIQPLRKRPVFRLRNGNKHTVGGFSVKDEGNNP